MWAPADLFSPALNAVLYPMKEGVSALYEHPYLTALGLAAIVALITFATDLLTRSRRRGKNASRS